MEVKLIKIWLVLETLINLYMAFVWIPGFYSQKPFIETRNLSPSPTCKRNLKKAGAGLLGLPNVSHNGMAHALRDFGDLDFGGEQRILEHKAHKASASDISKILNSPECWGADEEVLSVQANRLLKSPRANDKLLGSVLLVCGLLAPMGEMIVRLLHNLIVLFGINATLPSCAAFFDGFYESSHHFLQHLTQFKLFLVFLQTLVNVVVFGQSVMNIRAQDGVKDFVIFVVWSIIVNTVARKAEQELPPDEPLLHRFLPPDNWAASMLGVPPHDEYILTKSLFNILALSGFWVFWTRSCFTMVYTWEQHAKGTGVQKVTFYDESFLPIWRGFGQLWANGGFGLLYQLLAFQFCVCNLAVPLTQFLYVVVTQVAKKLRLLRKDQVFKRMEIPLLPVEEGSESAVKMVQRVLWRPRVPGESKTTQLWTWLDTDCGKLLQVILYACVQNQAHEYFLLAFAMMIHTLLDYLGQFRMKLQSVGLTIRICYDPLVLLWFLFAVPLLSRARSKLMVAQEKQDERFRSDGVDQDSTKVRALTEMHPQISETDGTLVGALQHLCKWLLKKEHRHLVAEVCLVIFFAYFLVFITGGSTFGIWTLNYNYVSGFYTCKQHDGYNTRCYQVEGNASSAEQLAILDTLRYAVMEATEASVYHP